MCFVMIDSGATAGIGLSALKECRELIGSLPLQTLLMGIITNGAEDMSVVHLKSMTLLCTAVAGNVCNLSLAFLFGSRLMLVCCLQWLSSPSTASPACECRCCTLLLLLITKIG